MSYAAAVGAAADVSAAVSVAANVAVSVANADSGAVFVAVSVDVSVAAIAAKMLYKSNETAALKAQVPDVPACVLVAAASPGACSKHRFDASAASFSLKQLSVSLIGMNAVKESKRRSEKE